MDMTPERWQEIGSLVDEALQLPGHERARFLIRRCSGDEIKLEQALDLLLASDEAADIVTPAWVPSATSEETAATDDPPRAETAEEDSDEGLGIGSFRVLRQLGRGGMGTVYLAEQTSPVERRVAIKVAHNPLGREGRLRLAAERQAMARLSHPNIAQVLEAGSTEEDHPYFAMELVEGAPITTHCDSKQLGLEERLQLFVAVCSGVQHAHQKGILHRDLKPNNIMVSEIDGTPVPKIIDFGIAKALDQPLVERTLDTGYRILGTPAYLSPEAFASPEDAAVDTRSDVYSLGVLLQELLIGERPFAVTPGETPLSQWRRKTEEDPRGPSHLWGELDPASRQQAARQRGSEITAWGRRLRGDLDWIVLRAIARDPVERYSSVSELAADIERYLKDEPVLAGPPTATYQLRKLVRRNRTAVAFSALLLLALVGGFIARTLEANRANREAAEAVQARDQTEHVVDFLGNLLDTARPERSLGRELTVREVLASGIERLEGSELDEAPRAKARLFDTIANVTWRQGDAKAALELAEQALTIRRREFPTAHGELSDSLEQVGVLESEVGNYERSEKLLDEALAMREVVFGKTSVPYVITLRILGAIHEETSRNEEALAYYERGLELSEEFPEPAPLQVSDLLNNMGIVLRRMGEVTRAEAAYLRSLELKQENLPENHPAIAQTLNNLGDLLSEQNRLEESHEYFRRALEVREDVLGKGHPDLGVTLNSMGDLQRRLGNWDEAKALFQQAGGIWEEAFGPEHNWLGYTARNVGLVEYSVGRDEEAEAQARRAISLFLAAFGEDSALVADNRYFLGVALRAQGRLDEAAEVLAAAHEVLATVPAKNWISSVCLVEQGRVAWAQGRRQEAVEFFERAREQGEQDEIPDSRLGKALVGLATVAEAEGRIDDARRMLNRALECFAVDLPPNHREVLEATEFLASLPS